MPVVSGEQIDCASSRRGRQQATAGGLLYWTGAGAARVGTRRRWGSRQTALDEAQAQVSGEARLHSGPAGKAAHIDVGSESPKPS